MWPPPRPELSVPDAACPSASRAPRRRSLPPCSSIDGVPDSPIPTAAPAVPPSETQQSSPGLGRRRRCCWCCDAGVTESVEDAAAVVVAVPADEEGGEETAAL